jgi:hypothetical protein
VLIVSLLFVSEAGAQAANGMPAPFAMPYPNLGYCGGCQQYRYFYSRHPLATERVQGRSYRRVRAARARN